MKTQQAYFLSSNHGMGIYEPRHELLHPESKVEQPGDSLTETHYFGFNIPEHRIHGMEYLSFRPNLGVLTAGIWGFQDFKLNPLASEMWDWRTIISDKCFNDDLRHFALENGLRAQMLEPGRRYRVQYDDAKRGNHLDIEYTAVMPPYMFASNKHFEQTMKTYGEVALRGKRYKVNGYTIRDRSWGQLRSEANEPVPPITWMSGAFGDDFSFCCSAFDHPDRDPEWKGMFDLPKERVLSGGFVWRDGELRSIVGCEKRTVHSPTMLFPERIDMRLTDSKGDACEITGRPIAVAPISTWHNVWTAVCLMRWECEGFVGYGDAQDIQWTDYIHGSLKKCER